MIDQLTPFIFILVLATATQITFPAPVDLIVLGLAKVGINPIGLVVCVTVGMLVGASFDYYVGKHGIKAIPWLKKKTNSRSYHQAEHFYQQYGQWTLLFTFLPFVGKYFPFISGLMELSYKRMLSLFVLGKVLYYGTFGILLVKFGVLA